MNENEVFFVRNSRRRSDDQSLARESDPRSFMRNSNVLLGVGRFKHLTLQQHKHCAMVALPRNNFSKLNEGDSSPNENDIWDDSLLIEAYDKAVNLAHQSLKKPDGDLPKNSKIRKKGGDKWKVGDKVRCQYSEDLKFYEADIIQVIGAAGMCIVRYVGYENEEEIPLQNLKPSEGESARLKQIHEAKLDNEENVTVQTGQDKISPSRKKQSSKKFNKKDHARKKDNYSDSTFPSINFPLPQIENSMIPPPPPPQMFNQLSGDENEAEAMSAMLISWYMSGYHTGYYQGLKMAKRQ